MPYMVSWMQHAHIILVEFEGAVTFDELRTQLAETIALSETVETPLVHVIVDSLKVTEFPKSIKDYQHIYGKKAHNLGWSILITENRFMKFVSAVVTTMTPVHFAALSTMHDAMIFISARDADVGYTDNRPTIEFKQI